MAIVGLIKISMSKSRRTAEGLSQQRRAIVSARNKYSAGL
jgi:hypothetical protein